MNPPSRLIGSRRIIFVLLLAGCGSVDLALPPPRPIPSSEQSLLEVIAFLERRIEVDPDDIVAVNRLGNSYLQRVRQTGDHSLIAKALRVAEQSLRALPAEVNPGGVALMGRALASSHRFAEAREEAQRLISLHPEKAEGYLLLSDTAFELGDYQQAAETLQQARARGADAVAASARAAKLGLIRGDIDEARRQYTAALGAALMESARDRDTVAWLYWQLGETEFGRGDLDAAQRWYSAALTVFPDYIHGLASMSKIQSARGNLDQAIALLERVVAIDPVPMYAAALADLHAALGRDTEAERLLALIDEGSRDPLDSRQIALIWADHDRHVSEAYEMARADYANRRDVYGADVLAWAALKAGRIDEARVLISEGLRLGTRDARLYYHAGMIAKAAGDPAAARRLLSRALDLNPYFDFRQAVIARQTLAELKLKTK